MYSMYPSLYTVHWAGGFSRKRPELLEHLAIYLSYIFMTGTVTLPSADV